MRKFALRALEIFVLGVFLQWIGMPTDWPGPPGTIYAEIASLVGIAPSDGHSG